jgi:hypothetical protein
MGTVKLIVLCVGLASEKDRPLSIFVRRNKELERS